MKTWDLSIVIPVFNEEKRLPKTLRVLEKYLEQRKKVELLFVDDGSTDKTRDLLQKARLQVLSLGSNKGKGHAVKIGMLKAKGKLLLFTDADLATPLSELPQLEAAITQGHAIAIASRGLATSHSISDQSFLRKFASVIFGFLARILLIRGVSDTQCGFKLFTREAARLVFVNTTSASPLFDMEALLIAARCGSKVAEVACLWKHHPDSRLRYNGYSALKLLLELLRLKVYYKVWLPVNVRTTQFERVV